MAFETLTLKRIEARPVVARIATLADWPLILIDLYTDEGVVGRAYLAPLELFEASRKSLHFVGSEGPSMIAVAGIDSAFGPPACTCAAHLVDSV